MTMDADHLLQTFREESLENLAGIEDGLMQIEARPGDDEALNGVFRAAHTIKGNAASLGFQSLKQLAHLFEDVLARLRERTLAPSTELMSALLGAVDLLRAEIAQAVGGSDPVPANASDLRAALQGYAGADAAPVPAVVPIASESLPAVEETRSGMSDGATLRIGIDRLDRMLRLSGEIAIARGRLEQLLSGERSLEALETHRETARLFQDLQDEIMQARLVPLGPVFRRYQRTVRDLAVALQKDCQLVVDGEEVEVDTTVIEQLRDPLMHMIRNALDHGIEYPEMRALSGKQECGRITLRARREAGTIVIEVEDDGRGLDLARIREVAVQRGLDVEGLRDADLAQVIFAPGFSTAQKVTDLSGRGVGMEVVKRNVERLRGTIAVETQPDRGTRVIIRVPLTLAIIDGFMVAAGDEAYVLPLDAVVECLEIPGRRSGHAVMNVRGQAVSLLPLAEFFAVPGAPPRLQNVVIVRHGDRLAGLVVDHLLGQSQIVIKPLSKLFRGLPGVAGSTILGSGRVALILDVPALLREAVERQARRFAALEAGAPAAAPTATSTQLE